MVHRFRLGSAHCGVVRKGRERPSAMRSFDATVQEASSGTIGAKIRWAGMALLPLNSCTTVAQVTTLSEETCNLYGAGLPRIDPHRGERETDIANRLAVIRPRCWRLVLSVLAPLVSPRCPAPI